MGGSVRFSIVVPTFERPAQLRACLAALARLDYPKDRFEVIVVDDGGTTPLEHLVHAFDPLLTVRLVRQTNAGAAAARNAGARGARGDYLLFTDDDCAPEPDWLLALAEQLSTHPCDLLGGQTLNALPDNLFAYAAQHILDQVYAYYNRDPEAAAFFASNNIALSRRQFEELGGFDPRFARAAAEDRDLCDRWREHGWSIAYAESALVRHAHPLGLRGFWRMYFNYGRGAYRYHRFRAVRGGTPMRIDSGFHAAAMQSTSRTAPGPRRAALLGLYVIWQLANATGFACELVGAHMSDIKRARLAQI